VGLVGTLFDDPSFDRERLARSLVSLASDHIYIGGSSWKYEGWIGQIYDRANYLVRGRFSRKLFESTCLTEYAATFPTVCGDFAFYQFPTADFWRKLFPQVPSGFYFAFKVPEQITCLSFPRHSRYGGLAGKPNELFLNSAMLGNLFLRPLLPFRRQIGLLIFEFGHFSQRRFSGLGEFVERLDRFLAALPPEFRYAVEVRNPEFLEREYFECLHRHGVAHVYNAWTRMPEPGMQMAMPGSATADFLVCRALLRRGRSYEEAVAAFSPYNEVKDPNPAVRDALRLLIRQAREKRQLAFLFINNRLEGNAPATIVAILED